MERIFRLPEMGGRFCGMWYRYRFYTMRERDLDEIFPWDFIDIGVSKDFLKREWKNAHDEKVTPNCRMKCSGCGAMKFGGGVCFENKD